VSWRHLSVRDLEVFEALSDEQKAAAGRIAIQVAGEMLAEQTNAQGRIGAIGWSVPSALVGLTDRLRAAGFPLPER
jgi:hypothetical protein